MLCSCAVAKFMKSSTFFIIEPATSASSFWNSSFDGFLCSEKRANQKQNEQRSPSPSDYDSLTN